MRPKFRTKRIHMGKISFVFLQQWVAHFWITLAVKEL